MCVEWDLVCDGHSVPDGWKSEKEGRQTLSLILYLLSPVLVNRKICLIITNSCPESYMVQKLMAYTDIK